MNKEGEPYGTGPRELTINKILLLSLVKANQNDQNTKPSRLAHTQFQGTDCVYSFLTYCLCSHPTCTIFSFAKANQKSEGQPEKRSPYNTCNV